MTERRSDWFRRPLLSDEERAERRAFLEARRDSGIGSSEIFDLLNGSALDIYHAHTRPIVDEDVDGAGSIHMLRGNLLEPIALQLYARITGRVVRRERIQVVHPDYPGASCSPDGTQTAEDHEGEGNTEVKAPGWRVFRNLMELGTSDAILYQLHYSIAVRQQIWGSFVFVTLEHEDGPIVPVDVEAQEDLGRFTLEVASEFWTKHVLTRTPPDPRAWAALLEKAPRIRERPQRNESLYILDREEDADARALIEQRCEVDALLRSSADLKDDLTAEMDALLTKTYPGVTKFQVPGVAKCTRVGSRTAGGFDRTLLESHRPVDRDALMRRLMENGSTVEEAERFLDGLDLDLGRFHRAGREYEYWRLTEEKARSGRS